MVGFVTANGYIVSTTEFLLDLAADVKREDDNSRFICWGRWGGDL